jgi:GT2 family glycosyltransferase
MASAGVAPVVSVVMPAYNAAAYLADAIESVLAQTFPDFELIVVDDGSTDQTAAVARRLASRDRRARLVSTANGGPANARNTALGIARGRFVALLDSDDVMRPHCLATQIGLLESNPDVSIVTANVINRGGGVNFDGKPYWPRTRGVERVTAAEIIAQENAICILSVFKREVYEAIGGFDPEFSRNEDYEFWLRASLAGFVVLRNYQPLGFYRRHEGSWSSDEPRLIRGILEVLGRTDRCLPTDAPERETLRRQIDRFSFELPRAELRAALQQYDAAAVSKALRTVRGQPGRGMLGACASVLSRWPGPLLWAYRIRNRIAGDWKAHRSVEASSLN